MSSSEVGKQTTQDGRRKRGSYLHITFLVMLFLTALLWFAVLSGMHPNDGIGERLKGTAFVTLINAGGPTFLLLTNADSGEKAIAAAVIALGAISVFVAVKYRNARYFGIVLRIIGHLAIVLWFLIGAFLVSVTM